MDTVFALSSARGRAGVAVIRISGPEAAAAAVTLAGRLPQARRAVLRRLTSQDGCHLDTALVLFLPRGSSYTGEDTVELHVHGGQATVKAVLGALGALDGLRIAEAGEFTYQALMNGRLDLSEIEGLGDLIQAETEAQRRQALRLFGGALSRLVESWRSNLTRCAALLEASLDFSDEDLPPDILSEARDILENSSRSMRKEARGVAAAERVREGFEVAIVGAPNTGKSTLLNFLAGREAAIISEQAGTTRDVIEVRMDLGGLPVTILDLAGIRETTDSLEKIGVKRARSRAQDADMRLFLVDAAGIPEHSPDFRAGDLIRRAKADLIECPPADGISGRTGLGIHALTEAIRREFETRAETAMTAAHIRHRTAIEAAEQNLTAAAGHLETDRQRTELAAEEVRQALRNLGSLIGHIDTEQVLDEIFAGFCIGK